MSTHAHKDEKTAFGFWVYLMTDAVLFAGLFAAYAVLQSATFGGPAIYDFVSLPFVLIETALLLVSSLVAGLGLLAARNNKKLLVVAALVATFVLGAAFLYMEVGEFAKLVAEGSGPSRSAFLSAFFVLVGTHGAHVFFGLVWALVAGVHVWLRGLSESTVRKLALLSLFWHFLDIIWIFIFTFVYLIGVLAI